MIAVITGDVVNSRTGSVDSWLSNLNEALLYFGERASSWDIYRGDSFQLRLDPQEALFAAFYIKAKIKQDGIHDVRMSIGLGEESYTADKVSESNGDAYIYSGVCFDELKGQTLAVKSFNQDFDEVINLMLSLYLNNADNWSSLLALIVYVMLSFPKKSQKEIAELLGKSQSSVSEAVKRCNYDGLLKVLSYYKRKVCNDD